VGQEGRRFAPVENVLAHGRLQEGAVRQSVILYGPLRHICFGRGSRGKDEHIFKNRLKNLVARRLVFQRCCTFPIVDDKEIERNCAKDFSINCHKTSLTEEKIYFYIFIFIFYIF